MTKNTTTTTTTSNSRQTKIPTVHLIQLLEWVQKERVNTSPEIRLRVLFRIIRKAKGIRTNAFYRCDCNFSIGDE